ncbi:VanZ family protein [Patescibacteria group bacterium]
MGKKLSFFVKYWLPFFVWAAIIFKLSSKSILTISQSYWKDFAFKKSAHVFFYGVYAILLFRALKVSRIPKLKAAWWSVILTFVYGVSDEFHQSFVGGRGPTLRDVLIDTAAASLVILTIYKYVNKLPKKVVVFLKELDLV